MKTKIYLLLSFILLTLILLSGCGGNDSITQPVSLSTPVSNTSISTGYILIRIVWPDGKIAGHCNLSTPDKKSLTASMSKNTYGINFTIYPYGEPDNILADKNFMRTLSQPEIEGKIEDLPVARLIVKITPLNLYNTPLSDEIVFVPFCRFL